VITLLSGNIKTAEETPESVAFSTHHRRPGVPISVVKESTGGETESTVSKFNHVTIEATNQLVPGRTRRNTRRNSYRINFPRGAGSWAN